MDNFKHERDKTFYETLAKSSLVQYFDFCKEEIYLAEQPDIQSIDQKVGIEVVRDVFKEQMEMETFAMKIWGAPLEQIPFEKLENFKRKGGEIKCDESGTIIFISLGETRNTSEYLKETICKKIDLLNGENYVRCKEYSLYVFTDTFPLECNGSLIVDAMDYVQNYQKNLNFKFKKIYLDQLYILYECDLTNGTYNKIILTKRMISDRRKEINQLLL